MLKSICVISAVLLLRSIGLFPDRQSIALLDSPRLPADVGELQTLEQYLRTGGGDQCDDDGDKVCCICEYQNCPPTFDPGINEDLQQRCEQWVNSNGCEQYSIVPTTPQVTVDFPWTCFTEPPDVPEDWEGCDELKHVYFGHGHQSFGGQCITRSIGLCLDMSCTIYVSDYSPTCQIFGDPDAFEDKWADLRARIPEGVTVTITGNQTNTSNGCNPGRMTYTVTCEATEVELPPCNSIVGDNCSFQNPNGDITPPLDGPENEVSCRGPDGTTKTVRCCPKDCSNNREGRWIDGDQQCPQVPVCGTKCTSQGTCRPNPRDTTQPVSLLCRSDKDCGYARCNNQALCEWKAGRAPLGHVPCTGHSSCGHFGCDGANCEWKAGQIKEGEVACTIDCECPTPTPTPTSTPTQSSTPTSSPTPTPEPSPTPTPDSARGPR